MSQAENPAAAVLGLAAMIVVVGGLTWLFTSGPASSPRARTSSQGEAVSSPLNEKAGPSAHIAAVPGHEEQADVNPPSEIAPSIPTARIERRLLSFLKHGPGKEAIFDLDRVSFDAGKPALAASSQGQLQQIAKVLNAFPKARVVIGVHGGGGSEAQIARLSAERARSLRRELARLGVGQSLLTSIGEGRESHSGSHEAMARDSYVWISVRKK